jgi:hypothetical protein
LSLTFFYQKNLISKLDFAQIQIFEKEQFSLKDDTEKGLLDNKTVN